MNYQWASIEQVYIKMAILMKRYTLGCTEICHP